MKRHSTMHPALPALIELQKLDLLIQHDRELSSRLPQELAALEKLELAKKSEIHALEEKIRHTELERRHLELQEKTHRERIAKLRTQQMQTRKNEEYQALETEISSAQQAISQTEDQQLALLDSLELLNKELTLAQERFSRAKEKIDFQAAEARAKAGAASHRIEKNRRAAAEARARVDADLLAKYDRLVAGGKTNAVVPLSHGTVCSGCHMNVVHQTALDARSSDKIAACENCGRILYDPEFEAAAG